MDRYTDISHNSYLELFFIACYSPDTEVTKPPDTHESTPTDIHHANRNVKSSPALFHQSGTFSGYTHIGPGGAFKQKLTVIKKGCTIAA